MLSSVYPTVPTVFGQRKQRLSEIFSCSFCGLKALKRDCERTAQMKIKLTKAVVRKLQCDKGKARTFFRDTICRGLVIEVRDGGGKTYYLSVRDDRGKQRLYKIGEASSITPTTARKLCDQKREELITGSDIFAEKKQHRSCLTYAEYFNEHYIPYVKGYKRSWSTDLYYARNHIFPAIGNVYLDDLSVSHVRDVLTTSAERLAKTSVYRFYIILRYSLNLAIKWKLTSLQHNPTNGYTVKKPDNPRSYYLSGEEVDRLLAAVNKSGNIMLRYIIPLLLLTGARSGEIRSVRWEHVDLERRFIRVPLSKNGSERYIPLNDAAIALLKKVPRRHSSIYVFANPNTGKPYTGFYRPWERVRQIVGLPHIRIHDLRHSFASFLVNAGCSLYEVQKILGHKSATMTQRYSHLNQSSLLRAASVAEQFVDISTIRGRNNH